MNFHDLVRLVNPDNKPDGPLQVWHNKEPVGLLSRSSSCHIKHDMISLSRVVYYDLVLGAQEYPIRQRGLNISRLTLEMHREEAIAEMLAKEGVGQNAVFTNNVITDSVDVRWNVLDLSTEEFEVMFDFDEFEPLEHNGPDPDRIPLGAAAYSSIPVSMNAGGGGGSSIPLGNGGAGGVTRSVSSGGGAAGGGGSGYASISHGQTMVIDYKSLSSGA